MALLVPLDRVVTVSRIIWLSLRLCSAGSVFLVDFIVFTFQPTSFSLLRLETCPFLFLPFLTDLLLTPILAKERPHTVHRCTADLSPRRPRRFHRPIE